MTDPDVNAPLGTTAAPDEKDESIAELEKKLQDSLDKRNEERFIWIFVLFLVADLFMFADAKTWGFPVSIAVLELVLLIILGRKLGVDDITLLTNKILDKLPLRSGDDTN